MSNWQKTAVIFPGQGSQVLGMGKDFAERYPIARHTFQEADDILGYDLSRICWNGPATELNQTANTQPALFVCGMAIWRALGQLIPNVEPAFVAGHSLGEFTALAAADAMSMADGLRLVQVRGKLMEEAGKRNPGAMAALLALDTDAVTTLCSEISEETGNTVVLANDNCPGQVVVSGHIAAVDRIVERAPELGAKRAVKLAVSVAAHSPLMATASASFQDAVRDTALNPPSIPVIGNVEAQALNSAADIRSELERQLTQPVRWTESMRTIVAQGVNTFVEIGPGTVLSGLMRRIDRKKARIAINNEKALDNFLRSQA